MWNNDYILKIRRTYIHKHTNLKYSTIDSMDLLLLCCDAADDCAQMKWREMEGEGGGGGGGGERKRL